MSLGYGKRTDRGSVLFFWAVPDYLPALVLPELTVFPGWVWPPGQAGGGGAESGRSTLGIRKPLRVAPNKKIEVVKFVENAFGALHHPVFCVLVCLKGAAFGRGFGRRGAEEKVFRAPPLGQRRPAFLAPLITDAGVGLDLSLFAALLGAGDLFAGRRRGKLFPAYHALFDRHVSLDPASRPGPPASGGARAAGCGAPLPSPGPCGGGCRSAWTGRSG